ncbi:MAG TPA: imelysin family protein [Acidimicrobiales bacterium]|jgi:putative iron-regulated protein|nr:imelysin family protein [Acidimicrobiales bacterium]
MRVNRLGRVLVAGLVLSVAGSACSGSDDDADGGASSTTVVGSSTTASTGPALALTAADASAAATTYADVVFASYRDTVAATTEMQTSIRAFTTTPSEATLAAARQTWVRARELYGPTEVFRFYDGPIDAPETGPEGRINAWPLDESYIDYTAETPESGIVNDVAGVPDITTEVLVAANEQGGETNISTGWHAIEFLLWGQDTDPEGPGARPATDYATAPNAARRATYLNLLADLLVADLTSVRDQWNPEGGPYRAEFLADPTLAVQHILRGMGALSSGELAGERMAVPYETKEQEDEHSCFSDNTLNDIIGNARGVRLAYTAEYEGVQGDSLSAVVARLAPEVDADLRKQLDNNVAAAEALPGPFDQMIQRDDDDPGRVELLALVEDLQDQGDAIAALASSLGLDISIEI